MQTSVAVEVFLQVVSYKWQNGTFFETPCSTDLCGCEDASSSGPTVQTSFHRSHTGTVAPLCDLSCASSGSRLPWMRGSTPCTSTYSENYYGVQLVPPLHYSLSPNLSSGVTWGAIFKN